MKKMKFTKIDSKRILIYLSLDFALTALFIYTTRNYIYGIVLFLINLIFFLLLVEKEFKKFSLIDRKTHECISFINNFIITLSINNSITTTFESVRDSFKGELKQEIDSIDHLMVDERLKVLKTYFNLSLYEFFLKIINQYEYNGGNILQISQLLIFDSRKLQTSLDNFKSVSKRKMIEFMTMWGITLIILVVIQVALNMFYNSILKMSFYTPSIFAFFIMFLLFIYLFIKHQTNLTFINEKKEKVYEVKNED